MLARTMYWHRNDLRGFEAHQLIMIVDCPNSICKFDTSQRVPYHNDMARPRKYTQDVGEVLRLHAQGNTVREIAHKLGISKSTVHRMIDRVADNVVSIGAP